MKRQVITTGDGSKTIQIQDWNEQYHSIHGAIQEANHVFIKHGLLYKTTSQHNNSEKISLLEIGFGTGLNAFITLMQQSHLSVVIDYVGVEAYPVKQEEIALLNYTEQLNAANFELYYNKMHACSWEESHQITDDFTLTKQQKFFKDIQDVSQYDLIYFDAFGARVQPELWTSSIFQIMYTALKPEGVLVTYSAKGSVRRAMQEVGFTVERLPGPPGKREMLRATKCSSSSS